MVLIETDTIERIQVLFTFLVEICRIGMGCFTSVFVSHMCEQKECTFMESIFPSDFVAIFTILINLMSFLILLSLFIFELCRENWLISNFDKDTGKPETYLSTHIHSNLHTVLNGWNRTYWIIATTTLVQ